jgi:pseudaminic acid biosynthesis-associated methylase
MPHSFQEETWSGNFGREYTERNTFDLDQLDTLYLKNYGVSRSEMNLEFIDNLDRSSRILEVGANSGNQLLLLQKMGFTELYGIEINEFAVDLARKRLTGINILKGSAFDIPFKDNYFDLVFTAGVLIHISGDDVNKVIYEMNRCSKRLIWGFEYYSDSVKEISYRGSNNLLWKADFAKLFISQIPELKMVKEKKYKYLEGENVDFMYLLEK